MEERAEKRVADAEKLEAFRKHLMIEEKAKNTVEKYLRDVRAFLQYLERRPVTKEAALAYKERLTQAGYAPASVNSMLVSLNHFFEFCGWYDLKVKTIRRQRETYCPEERELSRAEYERLVLAAREEGNTRLELILQTICGTGIRVSELVYITVEAARSGEAVVSLKGKTRKILIVRKLQKLLLAYVRKGGLETGPIFITRNGKPVSRSNIWREMKALCEKARVSPSKVFPHNLRHLFARIFYGLKKDIAKLADILGHSSIETTRIYIISTGAEHRRYLESMRLII